MTTRKNVLRQFWYDFVKRNVPEYVSVIFANQDAPRPCPPYITIFITGGRPKGLDAKRYTGSGTKFDLCGWRQFNVSLNAFGEDANDFLQDLVTLIDSPNEVITQKKADIGIVSRGQVRDLTAKLETKFEQRANLEIIFDTNEIKTVDPSAIESVEVDGEFTKADDSIVTVPTINVP